MDLQERIAAVHIMQRFVRMSRVLLPIYNALVHKENPSAAELEKVEKIDAVYKGFSGNPEASIYLIDSDILRMIINVYNHVSSHRPETPESIYEYNEFIKESDRLIKQWNKQLQN
jgi:hypothetical protein